MNPIVGQPKKYLIIPNCLTDEKSLSTLVEEKTQEEFLKIFSVDCFNPFSSMIKQLKQAFTVVKPLNQKKTISDQKTIDLHQEVLEEIIGEHFQLEKNLSDKSILSLDNEKRYYFISLFSPSIAQEISSLGLNFFSFNFELSEKKNAIECSSATTLAKKTWSLVVEEIRKILKKDELFVHLFALDKCVELIINQYPYDQFIHFPWMERENDLKGLRIVRYRDLANDLKNNPGLKDFDKKFIAELISLSAYELNKILNHLYKSNDENNQSALFSLSQWIRCLKITELKKISFIDFSNQGLVEELKNNFNILKNDEKVIDLNVMTPIQPHKILSGLINQTKFYRIVAQKKS